MSAEEPTPKSRTPPPSEQSDLRKFGRSLLDALHHTHQSTVLSFKAVELLHSIVSEVVVCLTAIAMQAATLSSGQASQPVLVNSRDYQRATTLLLPGALGKNAVVEAVRAVMSAAASRESPGLSVGLGKNVGLQQRSKLDFRIRPVVQCIKDRKMPVTVADGGAVYVTAVVQYLCEEILDLAGQVEAQSIVEGAGKPCVGVLTLNTVLQQDVELKELIAYLQVPRTPEHLNKIQDALREQEAELELAAQHCAQAIPTSADASPRNGT